jgi:hypothetical protein
VQENNNEPKLYEVRPTTKADCDAFYRRALPYRIKAYSGLDGGEVIAIGGLGFLPDGKVTAFADLNDHARSVQGGLVLHRIARRVLDEAKAAGIGRLIAQLDDTIPAAERWLRRLGFEPLTPNDKAIWIWRH